VQVSALCTPCNVFMLFEDLRLGLCYVFNIYMLLRFAELSP
jgi:hypothetical protein